MLVCVSIVIYTDTHTYKQKVLPYSKFMFNSKAIATGDRTSGSTLRVRILELMEFALLVNKLLQNSRLACKKAPTKQ